MKYRSDPTRIRGSIAPVITPFQDDGALDLDSLRGLVRRQLDAGSHGISIGGSTGEPSAQTVAERIAAIETVAAEVDDAVPFLPGTGSAKLDETLAITAAARAAGADAALVITPYYARPTQEALYRWFATIAGEFPDLPIVIYNVPSRTAVDVAPETVARLFRDCDNVVGIKETTKDFEHFSRVLHLCGRDLMVWSGIELLGLPLLALGGAGFISAVSNLAPGAVARMYEAWEAGDHKTARDLHYALHPLVDLLFVETNPAPAKWVLHRQGLLASDHVRAPLLPLTPEARSRVEALLEQGTAVLDRRAAERGGGPPSPPVGHIDIQEGHPMTATDIPQAVLGAPGTTVDTSGHGPAQPTPWAPLRVTAAEIAEAVERLSQGPRPGDGRRSAALVHPESTTGRSFSPGVEVVVEVLLPGESTTPVRRNSSLVQIGVEGSGTVRVGDTSLAMDARDVATVPSMRPHQFVNDGDRRWVRLAYSNAPLLDFLGTHFWEELDAAWLPGVPLDGPIDMDETDEVADRGSAPDHEISPTGARLRGYEYLVDIEPVANHPLHWPYEAARALMSETLGDGKRTIMALYNTATERRQGATNSFFVTLSRIPAGLTARAEGPGHRHSSVAINYHVEGTGYSVVDGQRIDFAPGDLLLSAPSWREHAHYPSESGLTVYTVQDHPQHIGMESLIWQEDLNGPIFALGLEKGQTGYTAPRNWDD